MNVTRRDFIRMLLGAGFAGVTLPLGASGVLAFPGRQPGIPAEADRFSFTQLRYRGGDWDPDPSAAANLADALVRRTSIPAATARKDLTIMSPDLFSHPMIYMTGHHDFEPFSGQEVARLREYLDYGGLLVADDCAGHPGFDFDAGIRRELSRLYPERPLAKLPRDHALFHSFYVVKSVGGRRMVSPYLEGIDLGGRTAVIYCQNDLGCALERDESGGWVHPCIPGGERQRRQAFQLAVNTVMYALCQDYKNDKIHLPFLRQRV